jgi:hypothetical protein
MESDRNKLLAVVLGVTATIFFFIYLSQTGYLTQTLVWLGSLGWLGNVIFVIVSLYLLIRD